MQIIRANEVQKSIVNWAGQAFHGKENELRAVTLTFRPSYKFKEALRSNDFKVFLKRLNRKVYGKSYVNGYAMLKCFPVFENNLQEGVHVHMFLGTPCDSTRLTEKSFEETVISEWLKMKCAGIKSAQDIRPCNDVIGWAEYITKRITNGNSTIMVDVENMNY